MTLKEIIYSIWEKVEGFVITDDTRFEYSYIKHKVIQWNQSLIREHYDNKMPLDGFYQTIACNEVECMKGTCVIDGVTFTDDTIYYTIELPSLHKGIGYSNIAYLGLNGYDGKIDRVSILELMYSGEWTAGRARYTIVGDKAVTKKIPTTGFKSALLVGILNDPTAADGWTDDDEFPTPSAAKLELLVVKDIMSSGMPDLRHDAQIALQQQTQQRQQPNEEE